MDSYYRSIKGFCILIEKEFLSFGHKIALRAGHDEMFCSDSFKEKETSPIMLQVGILLSPSTKTSSSIVSGN